MHERRSAVEGEAEGLMGSLRSKRKLLKGFGVWAGGGLDELQ